MSNPFLGEIRMFGGSFAPSGWAFCDGQLLAISQNTALFSLLGTTYGGDGQTTFALPDLRGRLPLHAGDQHVLGSPAGQETVALTTSQLPAHTHSLQAAGTPGTTGTPGPGVFPAAGGPRSAPLYGPTADTTFAPSSLSVTGGSQPHNNLQPFLAVSFIIALQGIFPARG